MSADARLRLEIVGEPGQNIDLPRAGVLKVGSDLERCDFALRGQGVAAVHCAIGRLKDGGWALKDLGSEFGTLVNGEACTSVRLEAGDQIALGSRLLCIVDPAATPTPQPAAGAAEPSDAPMDAPMIGGYRIGALLGRGGMGEVYSAVQESLQRRVALKLVSAKLEADSDFVHRFLAEARAAAALSHPNVVTVHDVGEDSGHHYLSMEYMEGGNLEDRVVRNGPLPAGEVIAILTDATKGLVFAELRGIVHRDIKPANLMRDGFGNTKIADLGLATQIEAQSEGDGDRKVFGTPHFISPEQARGERVDCRSDLYSLGATLYRLLSGRTPFEGQTTREILRGHFQERPRPLLEFVPDVPPALSQLVARLLEKDPANRYPSASALLLEVERLRTAPALPGGAATRGSSRVATWIGAALGIAALATVVWVIVSDIERVQTAGEPDLTASGGAGPAAPGAVPGSAPDGPTNTPPEQGDAVAPPTPFFDDDSALKVFERRAEEAYDELPADLTPAGRQAALAQLAVNFAGSTAASEWSLEIARLAATAEPATGTEGPAALQLRALRAAAAPGGEPLPLAQAWSAALDVPVPASLAVLPTFGAQRAAALDALLALGVADTEQRLAAIDGHAAAGDFDRVELGLEAALAALGEPALPADLTAEQLPHLLEVDALRAALVHRRDRLDDERAEFRRQQLQRDALALATGFGGPAGLELELATLDFDAATARLAALGDQLATEQTRQLVRELQATVAGNRRALQALAREFQAGTWRRKQVPDPRSKTRGTYVTEAVNERGLTLRIRASSQHVPWAAFGTHPTALHHLFHERLKHDYSPDELLDIAGLLRTAAVVRAAGTAAGRMRDSGSSPRTGAGENRNSDLLEGFAEARDWADLAGQPGPAEREEAAVRAMAQALDAAQAGSWSRSVARLEQLFDHYGDTLFVRLVSDGSGSVSSTGDE